MNLSIVSVRIKKLIVWGGIGFATLSVIWIFWLLLSFFWGLIFPAPPETANFAFGQISKPFTYNFDPKNTIFEIGTPGGKFEKQPSFVPVFAIPAPTGKFTSLDNAKFIARGAGLDIEPSKLSETDWRFTSQKFPNKSLKINIVTNNFSYKYDWTTDNSLLSGFFKTTDQEKISESKSIMSRFHVSKSDLSSGREPGRYFKLVNKDITSVSSYSEANAVRINFYRDDFTYKKKKYPIFESDPKNSLVNLLFSPKHLLEFNFTYWNIDFTKFGTYNIKSADGAYNDLRSGKALVSSNQPKFETITITNVTFGYLNPASEAVRYFQPVYNFIGEGLINDKKYSFQAYVLAVTDDYIK